MRKPFDINSNDNTLFVTEQCNNHCIMCCQPPKRKKDIDRLFKENMRLVRTAPKELMHTKHCLKYAFDMCKSPDKLYLIDEKGKKYDLLFDCKN